VVKSDRQIHFPPFRLDRLSGRVCRGDETIAIRPKAFAVLTYLLERRGKLATKDELLDACWPEMAVSDTVLSGYRFIGEITEDKGTRGQGDKETVSLPLSLSPCPIVPLSPCPLVPSLIPFPNYFLAFLHKIVI
jgi:hypothetical protein